MIPVSLLREHWLHAVECDHERKMDRPICACSRVDLGWHPSVGAAVEAWVSHLQTVAPSTGEGMSNWERYKRFGTLLPLGERPKENDAEIIARSSTAPSELEQKLDAIAKALGYPVECWRMAGCDVMAHAIGDLIANYGRLQAQFAKIDATLDELGAPVDCAWEGIKTKLSRRGRIKALLSAIGGKEKP